MQLAYGSTLSHAEPVLERVKAQVIDQHDGTFRLQCDAYAVQNANRGHQGNEIRLRRPRSGPYRDLLEQVAQKFSTIP